MLNYLGQVDEHSTHLTVDESWGLAPIPPESASGEKFASDMRTLMRETVKKFGSPDKYLQARYGTLSEKQGWVNYLAELQNVNGDQNYSVVADLPVSEMNKLSEAGCHCVAMLLSLRLPPGIMLVRRASSRDNC